MVDPVTIDNVINIAKSRNSGIDVKLLHRAYEYSLSAHKGQKRKSGEGYIQHPLHTAYTLAKMGMTSETITAGLMHDVPEDTEKKIEDIKKDFG